MKWFNYHRHLVALMKEINYKDEEGICFGVSMTSINAFLLGNIDIYCERIESLKHITADRLVDYYWRKLDEVILLESSEIKLYDILAFFDAIALLHSSKKYRSMLGGVFAEAEQIKLPALDLILPVTYKNSKPICCYTSIGVYSPSELIKYLKIIQLNIKNKISIKLLDGDHVIALHYDPMTCEWMLIDANKLPVIKTKDNSKLAREIIHSLNYFIYTDHVAFVAKYFSNEENKFHLKKVFRVLERKTEWQDLHNISLQKARWTNANGYSLLMICLKHEISNVNNILFEKSNLGLTFKGGITMLTYAAYEGYIEYIRLLVKYKANVNQTADDISALHYAVLRGHTDAAHLLIKNGADVNQVCDGEYTALLRATLAGHISCVQLLVDNNADVNYKNSSGLTALISAVACDHIQIIRILISKANVNQINKNGVAALCLAVRLGHTDTAQLLIENGAKVDLVCENGNTALLVAAFYGHISCAQLLIDNNANVDQVNDYGYTPLIRATRKNHHEIIRLLIKNKANVNHADNLGLTALHVAAENGDDDIVELLIQYGANLNQCDNEGYTALATAAKNGQLNVVSKILKNKVYLTNSSEVKKILAIAKHNGHDEIEMLINRSLGDTPNTNYFFIKPDSKKHLLDKHDNGCEESIVNIPKKGG